MCNLMGQFEEKGHFGEKRDILGERDILERKRDILGKKGYFTSKFCLPITTSTHRLTASFRSQHKKRIVRFLKQFYAKINWNVLSARWFVVPASICEQFSRFWIINQIFGQPNSQANYEASFDLSDVDSRAHRLAGILKNVHALQ